MPTVNFSGLATGLDTGSIIAQLVDIKRAPIRRLQTAQSGYEKQIKSLADFKKKLLALQTAAKAMDTSSEFSSLKASAVNPAFLTVTAGATAAPGTHTISVDQLAVAQRDVSQGFDSNMDSIGTGTISFTVNGTTTAINLTSFATVEGLAQQITNDVSGISAAVINDGSATGGYHLIISSEAAGTASAFTVDTSGLTGGITPVFTTSATASDALLTVDGIAVTATSNKPDDVVTGLTLNLLTLGSTTITVERDTEGIADKVDTYVKAYNDIFSFVKSHGGTDGDLRGNPTLSSVASRIESVFSSQLTGGLGAVSLISAVGIKRTTGREMTFDKTAFATALTDDFNGVRDLFIERTGNLGKTYLVDQAIKDMTDRIDGLFKISNDSLRRRIDSADAGIARYERSISSYEDNMRRKFNAMEQMVAQLNAQGSYLSSIF